MIGFDVYTPVAWVENGLLKHLAIKKQAVFKRQARRGKWTTGSAVLALSICAAVSTVTLLLSPNQVAEVDVLAPKATPSSLRPEDHRVPEGYWDRLGTAINSVARLPTQDISKDPPIMV